MCPLRATAVPAVPWSQRSVDAEGFLALGDKLNGLTVTERLVPTEEDVAESAYQQPQSALAA
jgi:hypothetical protein